MIQWMGALGTVVVSVTPFVAFGVLCLIDKNDWPLFPRWLGWFSLAMVSGVITLGCLIFLSGF